LFERTIYTFVNMCV